MTLSRTVVVILVGAVTFFVLFGGAAPAPEGQEAEVRSKCSLDDIPNLFGALLEDAQACFDDFLDDAGIEGDQHQIFLRFGGTWEQLSEPQPDPAGEGYAARVIVPGTTEFQVEVLNAAGDVVYSTSLFRDEVATLQVQYLDLPGDDILRVTDAAGGNIEVVLG